MKFFHFNVIGNTLKPQKIGLILLLVVISYLTYISMLKFTGATHFLYGKWVFSVFKNKILLKIAILLLINLSDVIIATGAGLLVGVLVKEKAKWNGFIVIAGAYILKTFITVRGKIYYDDFYLYLVEVIIMFLSITFCIIGVHIGANLRKFLLINKRAIS